METSFVVINLLLIIIGFSVVINSENINTSAWYLVFVPLFILVLYVCIKAIFFAVGINKEINEEIEEYGNELEIPYANNAAIQSKIAKQKDDEDWYETQKSLITRAINSSIKCGYNYTFLNWNVDTKLLHHLEEMGYKIEKLNYDEIEYKVIW